MLVLVVLAPPPPGYVSDVVVPASPDPPPASGGEGGQEKLPPACSPIPGPSSSRLLSPGRREKHLDPSGSSLAGPPRSPSAEGGGAVSVRVLPRFPLGIAPVPVLESAEREVRDIARAPESDVIVPVTRSDLATLAPALLLESILSSVHAPALAIFVESAPMIVETRVSTAHAILQNAPSTVLGLGSVPTAPELLRSEAIAQNAMISAPHRFWEKRRSDLMSVPYAKCLRA